MRLSIAPAVLLAALLVACGARADDATAKKELASTGKLRVGIAVAPTPGAGNVAKDVDGGYRGVAIDLGEELARKLGVPAEFVPYPNSGALTDAVSSGAWDVAFLPVDAQRKTQVDFGSAHIVLQSTYLVGPGSPIASLADVDKTGVRVAGVENPATARAAQASLRRSEEHTSELQSLRHLVCRLLLEKKKKIKKRKQLDIQQHTHAQD